VDAWQARKEKDKFLQDIHYTFDKRVDTAFYFMEKENWDYFHLHIMETDRINHFLWEQWEKNDPLYAVEFEKFYTKVDQLIGELDEQLKNDVEFMVLSDHGFCSIKKEVYLNHWLEQNGYLRYKTEKPNAITEMHPESKAYSLIPGRIYINLKGREDHGCISQGNDYESLREELMARIKTITDPDTGEKIIRHVYKREDIYNGPFCDDTSDLIAVPYNGFDLKGNINQPNLTYKGELVGMHTEDDATFYLRNHQIENDNFSIMDMLPTIADLLNLDLEEAINFDGKSILS
jgi:predicted AlkP superfamily phosphohydrolase/phosphomutase